MCACACVLLHICIYVLRGSTHLSVSRRICSLLCLLSSMRRSKSSSMMPKRFSSLSHWKTQLWNEIMCAKVSQSITHQLVCPGLHTWSTGETNVLENLQTAAVHGTFHVSYNHWLNLISSSRWSHSFVRFNTNKPSLRRRRHAKFNFKKVIHKWAQNQ